MHLNAVVCLSFRNGAPFSTPLRLCVDSGFSTSEFVFAIGRSGRRAQTALVTTPQEYGAGASTNLADFPRLPLNFLDRLLWRLSLPLSVALGMRVSLRGRRYHNRSCKGPAMPGQMRGWSCPTSWAGYIEDRLAHEFLTCGKDIFRGSIDELRVFT
jgi:hypothetical protein